MQIEELNRLIKQALAQRDLEWKEFIEFSILRLLSKRKAEEVGKALSNYKF